LVEEGKWAQQSAASACHRVAPPLARSWTPLKIDILPLSILIRSSRRTRLLEIGTSNGYSTIWLAWAASATGGHVISIDRDAHKQVMADANLRRAGLREMVELICGDATEVVASLASPFDCVFFDADRKSAPSQLTLLIPKLTTDVFVLADNVLSYPQKAEVHTAAHASGIYGIKPLRNASSWIARGAWRTSMIRPLTSSIQINGFSSTLDGSVQSGSI